MRVLRTILGEFARKRRVEALLARQSELLSAQRLLAQRQRATWTAPAVGNGERPGAFDISSVENFDHVG